jgi:predicted site-specific integrase-resolvase
MREASEALRVSDQVLRRRIKEGALECVREKGKVLFTSDQLEKYTESLKTTGPAALLNKGGKKKKK